MGGIVLFIDVDFIGNFVGFGVFVEGGVIYLFVIVMLVNVNFDGNLSMGGGGVFVCISI